MVCSKSRSPATLRLVDDRAALGHRWHPSIAPQPGEEVNLMKKIVIRKVERVRLTCMCGCVS